MTHEAGRSDDTIRYRAATRSDTNAIAALHTDNWRRNYRGLVADTYLDDVVEGDRAAVWQARMAESDERTTCAVVAEQGGQICGFLYATAGADPRWGTLLANLHVRHGSQRRGIGLALLGELEQWLDRHRHPSEVYLWVLAANQAARRFYEAIGGREVEQASRDAPDGSQVPWLKYAWPRLDVASRQRVTRRSER